ncbi:MAG TPA: ROK family protein, partial [Psychromonas sp.]
IEYLVTRQGYSLTGVMDMLQKQSGLLGVSGISSDFRDITENYEKGNDRATLAMEMFIYRLAKYIASYAVPLGHIDAIIFTGGIGENSHLVRTKVLELLTIFGYQVDPAKNKAAILGEQGIITTDGSPIAMVIPTNEEWVIAQDSLKLASA